MDKSLAIVPQRARMQISSQLIFENADTRLSNASKQILDRAGQLLNQYSLLRLQVRFQMNQLEELSIVETLDAHDATLKNLRFSAVRYLRIVKLLRLRDHQHICAYPKPAS